ncbi:hypothetical protein DBV15_02782 [Temnothorax longispinosus]|uniref:non-specific serine/threonine protein kinase n=1 Tax=Temnothorax longispinosus TaxID=300112 RepID=A0A4S2KKC2_9HYME|nr:hypothetical protein DBV15_02782 [Temnothorax longispinosus]
MNRLVKYDLQLLQVETTEASEKEHHFTITQHTTIHETKQQPTNDSDTEVTEEYTTKFRRGSKENETAAIKTKKTTIRKKKPKSKTEEDKVVVIEEEIEDIKSQVPSIPKKQFMHIEEVTGLIGIEEIVPTKIEELEDITQSQEEQIKTYVQNKRIIKKTNDIHDIQTKDIQKEDTENQLDQLTEKDESKQKIVTSPIKTVEKIVSAATHPEFAKPHEEEEVREQVTVIEEIVEGKKPKKITKKKIIKRKGQKQQVTEKTTVEEKDKLPVTTVLEGPIEEIVEETTYPLPYPEFAKPLEEEEVREQVTVTEEIIEGKKPKKITKKKIIKRKGQKQQEVRKQVTVTEEIVEGKKPKKVTKKKIIKQKGQKQQVTEETTVEEEDQLPVTTLVEGPIEEIVEETTYPLPSPEFAKPLKEEEVREQVTVTEEIMEGKKPKITKKKIIEQIPEGMTVGNVDNEIQEVGAANDLDADTTPEIHIKPKHDGLIKYRVNKKVLEGTREEMYQREESINRIPEETVEEIVIKEAELQKAQLFVDDKDSVEIMKIDVKETPLEKEKVTKTKKIPKKKNERIEAIEELTVKPKEIVELSAEIIKEKKHVIETADVLEEVIEEIRTDMPKKEKAKPVVEDREKSVMITEIDIQTSAVKLPEKEVDIEEEIIETVETPTTKIIETPIKKRIKRKKIKSHEDNVPEEILQEIVLEKPEMEQAQTIFSPKEGIEITQILTESSITKFTEDKAIPQKAAVHAIKEEESIFKKTLPEETNTIPVQEEITIETTKEILNEKPKEEEIKLTIITKEGLKVTEIISDTSTENFLEKIKPIKERILPVKEEETQIGVEEVIVKKTPLVKKKAREMKEDQPEEAIEDIKMKKPTKEKAKKDILLQESVEILEIATEIRPEEFVVEKTIVEKEAELNVAPTETIEVIEVTLAVADDKITEKEEAKPKIDVKEEQEKKLTSIKKEKIIEEKEKIVEEIISVKPKMEETKRDKVALKTTKEVAEVIPEAKVEDTLRKKKPKDKLKEVKVIHPEEIKEFEKPTEEIVSTVEEKLKSIEKIKEKKVIKKKKKPVKTDIEEWVEPEYERPVLEPMPEKIEWEPTKKKKEKKTLPESVQKLVRQKIERKEIKPTKLKYIEPIQETVQFGAIKLKKVTVVKKKEITEPIFPKIMLRSRITFIDDYPAELQMPKVTYMEKNPAQAGILSRNTEEALQIIKKKYKKPKISEKDLIELEKLDKEFEELKKVPLEQIEDKSIYERTPKKSQKTLKEPQKLIIGKGEIKQEDKIVPENVKLKKIPIKEPEQVIKSKQKPKKEKSLEDMPQKKEEKPEETFTSNEFKSIEFDSPEIEKYIPEEFEIIKKPEIEPVSKPYKPSKKKKPEQDIEQIPLVKGIPKPQEPEEEPEVKFRIPTSEKPEDEPATITLKGWKKTKPEKEGTEEYPTKEKDITPTMPKEITDEYTVKQKIKPKKIKEKEIKPQDSEHITLKEPVEEKQEIPTEELIVKRPRKKSEPEEKQDILDVSQEVLLKKPKEFVEEKVEDEVTITKQIIKKGKEDVKEVTEEITLKKKPKKKSITEEPAAEIIVKKLFPEKEDVPEEISEKVALKKPEKDFLKEEVAEEVTIKKLIIEEKTEDVKEITEEVTLKKKPKKKPVTEEPAAEITVKKPIPEEEEHILEEISEKVALKKPKKDSLKEVAEEVTIKKPIIEEKTEDVKEVNQEVTLKKKPKKKPVTEESGAEITVKKPVPKEEEQVPEEISEKVALKKMKEKSPKEEVDKVMIKKPIIEERKEDVKEVTEEVTLKKKPKKKKEDVKEVTEEVTLKTKSKKKPITEELAAEITVKKPIPKKEEQVPEEISEKVVLKKPKKEILKKEVADKVTIKKPIVEKEMKEDVIEEVTLKPKSRKKIIKTEEISEVTIAKPVEDKKVEEIIEASADVLLKEEKRAPIIENVITEELTIRKIEDIEQPEEVIEEFTLKRKPPKKAPKPIEEIYEDVTLRKLRPKKKSRLNIKEVTEVENVTFRPRSTKTKEDVEQEFKISLNTYEEEDISMSGKVRLKPKKRPLTYSEETGEETIKIIQEIEDDSGPIIEEIIDESEEEGKEEYSIEELDIDEMNIPLRRKKKKQKTPYTVEEIEEDDVKLQLKRDRKYSYEETDAESLALKLKSKRRISTFEEEEASLSITKEEEISEEDHTNQDWWFVKKHLTEEKGWVPAQYLLDEAHYTIYLQRKLHEKIDKLPIFEKPAPGEKGSAPRFIEKLQPIHTLDGYTVQFECQVEGTPRPQITWFRQTAIIKPSTDFQMYYDEDNVATLIIKEVFPEDAGTFTCVAKNAAGFASNTTELIVEAPLSDHGSDVTVKEGETVVLSTQIVGNPSPKIIWYKDGKPIKGLQLKQDGHVNTLNLIQPQLADSGEYSVTAINDMGKAETRATLTVEKVPSGAPEPPLFTKRFQEIIVPEKSTFKLVAKVTGNPVPEVTWLRNNKPLDKSANIIESYDGENIELEIKNANSESGLSDAGTYKCTVKNQMTSSNVIVRATKPEFVKKLQDFEVKERDVAILEVEITSQTADVTWQKDGELLTPSKGKLEFVKDGTVRKLFIRSASVHDEGEYTCALPDQECTAEVTVVELPPEIIIKMQDIIIARGEKATFDIELTKGDALVRWFKDGQELQFSEHVRLSIDGKRQKLKIYDTEVEDAGIYSCQVGDQTSSARLTVEEPEVDFIKKLPDVTLVPINTDATFLIELSRADVLVTWLRKSETIDCARSSKYNIIDEGNIKKLIVRKCTTEDIAEYTAIVANVKTSSRLKIEGDDIDIVVKFTAKPIPIDEWTVNGRVLKKSKRIIPSIDECSAVLTIRDVQEKDFGDYNLKLTNPHGEDSIEINVIVVQVPGAPGIPEPLEITDNSITLHWKKPDSDGHSSIIEYILEYREKTETLWSKITETIIETTYKLTNLIAEKEYTFRVTAVNEAGSGEASPNTPYLRISKLSASEPPTILEALKSIVIGLEEIVTLSCVIGGVPTPHDKTFEDNDITYENHVAKYTIWKTTETSSATFMVKAQNDAGMAETSCQLKIQESPKITCDENLRNQRLTVGDKWKVEIYFTGFPKPEVTWTINNKKIIDKRISIETRENKSIVTIPSLIRADTAAYTVKASNEAGSSSMECHLRVIDKPNKPQGPVIAKEIRQDRVTIEWQPPIDDGGVELERYTIEKCEANKKVWTKVETPGPPRGPLQVFGMTKTSFTLKWESPENDGGTPIVEYIVEMKETSKKAWQRIASTKGEITNVTISDLKTDTSYNFRITAKNSVGTGPPYTAEEAITAGKRPTPPSCPLNVRATNVTSKSVTLNWLPPTTTGGSELTGYVIEKRPLIGKGARWTKVVTLDATTHQYCIENLKESEFLFRIFAENSLGLSIPTNSEPVTLKTHANVPSPPTAPLEMRQIAANTMVIEWGRPESDGGAPLEGYKIAIRDAKKTMWMEVGRVSADIQKLNIRDLQENHEYLVRIFARNEIGFSDHLESEEPFKIVPTSELSCVEPIAEAVDKGETASLSFSTENTSSWLREHNMDADIHSYARARLLRKDDY